jgi:hypothetical protein
MNKVFAYISFGLEMAAVVENVMVLTQSKQPITKESLALVVNPAIQALHGISTKINPPQLLVDDIIQAAADAINKYVIKA